MPDGARETLRCGTTTMRVVRTALAAFALISLQVVSPLADAQEVDPEQSDARASVAGSVEPMEEVTVTAPASLRSLYAEIVAAQQAAFDMFNAVNDDNDFDIICRRERPPKDAWNPIANSWPTQVCSTPFVDRVMRNEIRDAVNGDGFFGDSSVDVQEHIEELVRKINEAAVEHPVFLQAMVRYKDARATYDEQRSDSIANSPINTFFRGLFGNADEGE